MEKNDDLAGEAGLAAAALDKVIRQYQLYGRQHPQFDSFLTELIQRLGVVFSKTGSLSFSVKRSELLLGTQAVFHLDKRENNYILEMYIDGIRELSFLPQITREELTDFASIMGRDPENILEREDDTVTLLWKKGLLNIRYATIDAYAGDRFAVTETQTSDAHNEAEKQELDYLSRFLNSLLDNSASPPLPSLPTRHHAAYERDIHSQPPPAYFSIPTNDSDALRQEIARASSRNNLKEVQAVFGEVLEGSRDDSSFVDLLEAYAGLVTQYLREGDLRKASDWLRILRAVQAYCTQRNVELHEMFERSIASVCTPETFRILGQKTADGVKASPEDWINFLSYLGRNAAGAIGDLLAHIRQDTLHTVIADFLIEQVPDEIDVYRRYLAHPNALVVRDMVRVLAALLPSGLFPSAFGRVAVHRKPEVRIEVLKASRRFEPDYAHALYLRALSDMDENVRRTALFFITRTPEALYAKPLAERIVQADFVNVDPEEKRAACVALARCAGVKALRFLSQIVETGGTEMGVEDLRLAALSGVAEIRDPAAAEAIANWAGKRLMSRAVRDAAQRLLERIARPEGESDA